MGYSSMWYCRNKEENNKNVHKLTIKHYIDSAHQLTDTPELITKACARLHGHTYAIAVTVGTNKLNGAGMVVDFTAVKQIINVLDHRYINDVFREYNVTLQPTAENIAQFLYEQLQALDIQVYSVAVCEGYKGEDKASWATYTPDI